MVDSSTVWLFSWISCLWNSKWTTSISIETLISHLPFSPLELNFKLTQNKYSLQSVINNSHEIQWVTGLNCSCPVLFSHHWGQSCLWFCPYGQKSSACTPLSSHADTAIPVEWQPIRSNVSKHTVISHQHHSKLPWFNFSLEKEVFLYFPTAICSSLLSAAADIILSLQLPFSCLPLQSENFSQAVLFAILEERILQAQDSLLCSSDVIGIRWFDHRALKNLEGLLQNKQRFIIFCAIYISLSYQNT